MKNLQLEIALRKTRNKFNHYRNLMSRVLDIETLASTSDFTKGEITEIIKMIDEEDTLALKVYVEHKQIEINKRRRIKRDKSKEKGKK